MKDELSKDRLRVMLMEMQKADTETIFAESEHTSVTSDSDQALRNMSGKQEAPGTFHHSMAILE